MKRSLYGHAAQNRLGALSTSCLSDLGKF
uniref:Uncharacterized protein n=1 Tax=Rhizophora mucronata TaxID=61149 RepID=A0A2P2J0T0_RHIMU